MAEALADKLLTDPSDYFCVKMDGLYMEQEYKKIDKQFKCICAAQQDDPDVIRTDHTLHLRDQTMPIIALSGNHDNFLFY